MSGMVDERFTARGLFDGARSILMQVVARWGSTDVKMIRRWCERINAAHGEEVAKFWRHAVFRAAVESVRS